jgi:hypothetical protein
MEQCTVDKVSSGNGNKLWPVLYCSLVTTLSQQGLQLHQSSSPASIWAAFWVLLPSQAMVDACMLHLQLHNATPCVRARSLLAPPVSILPAWLYAAAQNCEVEALRGQQSVRFTEDLQPGVILGVYR